ncbi:MAG: radical SAM protein [Candidatus Riflebacteria bacterium]|nr:radical SAM protein [Candidatus Riflebacteria bacterium]
MELTQKYFNQRKYAFNDLPDCIYIEAVMGCNLRCEMCPVPNSKMEMSGRNVSVMSMDTFKKVLDEVSDRPRKLHLNQMGEPLLNNNICEFVALAKKKNHRVSFTTNGTLMKPDIAKELLIAGIDQVTFSIDGFEAKTYESIRIGAKYEEVRSNIEEFCRLKKSLNKPTIAQIDCIISELTKNEISLMQEYWKGKVDWVVPIPLDDWAGKHPLPGKFGIRNWISRTSDNIRYPCDLLWTTLAVSAEGKVMYCCHDYKLGSNLPSIHNKSLKRIWEEDVLIERKKHVEGRIDKNPCLNCDAWKTRQPYISEPPITIRDIINAIPEKYRKALKRIWKRMTVR